MPIVVVEDFVYIKRTSFDDCLCDNKPFVQIGIGLEDVESAANEAFSGIKNAAIMAIVVEKVCYDSRFCKEIQKLRIETHFVEKVNLPNALNGNIVPFLLIFKGNRIVLAANLSHAKDISSFHTPHLLQI